MLESKVHQYNTKNNTSIIYAIGALILSVVILVEVCYFFEYMSMNNNGANGFIVLL